MMYTLSSQYAIRTMLYLASLKDTKLRRIEDVAESEEIPAAFLAKLVQRLVKKGLLHSLKGLNGGIKLGRPANEITLFMIADAIDDLSNISFECALGSEKCSDRHPCVLHERWKALRTTQIEFLQGITLNELVNKPKAKRKRRS
ncbi:MAG TPA: Rrf2 family transcriptional regulator [Acidobacteriota bacterium]|nr:Rrf2 family transcriptional regulator [Acidobacteriota bacterium]